MDKDISIKIGDRLKKTADEVWYAQQNYKEEGETRAAEICQEIIDRVLALRFYTITLEGKKRRKNQK